MNLRENGFVHTTQVCAGLAESAPFFSRMSIQSRRIRKGEKATMKRKEEE